MAKGGGGGGKGSGGGGGGASGGGGGGGNRGGGASSGGGGARGGAPAAPTQAPATPTNVTYNLNTSAAVPTTVANTNPSKGQVARATETVREQIKSITPRTGAIADPDAYKQALAVLTSAGKTKKAEKLTTKAEKEIKADTRKGTARGFLPKPGETPKPGEGETPGSGDQNNQYDLTKDPEYQSLLEKLKQSQTDKEGLEGQLSTLGGELAGFKSQLEGLRASKAEQTGGDYQPTDVSTSTTTEEFEPFSRDLFTSLLGELESSKKRQKDWDYEQALKAYKF